MNKLTTRITLIPNNQHRDAAILALINCTNTQAARAILDSRYTQTPIMLVLVSDGRGSTAIQVCD